MTQFDRWPTMFLATLPGILELIILWKMILHRENGGSYIITNYTNTMI